MGSLRARLHAPADVVGVIPNRTLFFTWHVLWPEATEAEPFSGRFEQFSLAISAAAFAALWRSGSGPYR